MNIDAVEAEVRALERLDLEGLRAEFRRRYGPPSKLRSVELLRFVLAWRIQAAAFGDLEPETRRSLRRAQAPKRQGLRLPVGTHLTREWKGERHEVEVVLGGFRYRGEVYRSLSKIAGVIAGSKWNGPRFFGVSPQTHG